MKSSAGEGVQLEEVRDQRFFPCGSGTKAMRLVGTKTFDTGVVPITYRARGNEK